MEYLDLSPYEYTKFPLLMLCIGWLGREHGTQGANEPPMEPNFLDRFRRASRRAGSIMLGVHDCEFCPQGDEFVGNGEFRYYMSDGSVYSAPVMVLHYIEKHNYHLPAQFRESLTVTDGLSWDWRAKLLAKIVTDDSQDLDFRCEAIVDIANWKDPRALDALMKAARDEELVDVTGEEIGRSLGLTILGCPSESENINTAGLAPRVHAGISQTLEEIAADSEG
ncbi:HEAT repeat domain-containing protein [Streptomyces sp. NPDC055078]